MKDTPTSLERFERRLLWRAASLLVGGLIGLVVIYRWLGPSLLLVALIVIWLLAAWAASTQLRRRDESVAAYKARVGDKH